jgi:hypothetical protein
MANRRLLKCLLIQFAILIKDENPQRDYHRITLGSAREATMG